MSGKKNQSGFTIIELLIAMAVFSFVLMICLAAFLQVTRIFYKGIHMSRTQESARNVIQSISDDVRFSGQGVSKPPSNASAFCVGNHRYKYKLGEQFNGNFNLATNYGLVRENINGACQDPSVPGSGTGYEEMLGNGMQLNQIDVSCANKLCAISLRIVFYGADNQVFASELGQEPAYKATDAECTGSLGGSQFCATAAYKTTILQFL